MSRRLDIGIASYQKTHLLQKTLTAIQQNSATDWRCFVIDNNSGPETKEIIAKFHDHDKRFVPVWLPENIGYAGAVCKLMELAETEYVGFLDDDAEVHTQGWDEKLCRLLDMHHEVGMAFPGSGAYPIDRGNYTECLWACGFAWVLSRMCMVDVGPFDTSLGHQEEADYCQRVRMAGYKCGALPEIQVTHHATATNNPAATERISRGVVNWVNKHNAYFNGKNFNYHSPNVTRFEDWPANALYLEEYWKLKPELAGLNDNPEVVTLDGRDYDLIKVPRLSGFYRGRII